MFKIHDAGIRLDDCGIDSFMATLKNILEAKGRIKLSEIEGMKRRNSERHHDDAESYESESCTDAHFGEDSVSNVRRLRTLIPNDKIEVDFSSSSGEEGKTEDVLPERRYLPVFSEYNRS
jgi:hypothetical protein